MKKRLFVLSALLGILTLSGCSSGAYQEGGWGNSGGWENTSIPTIDDGKEVMIGESYQELVENPFFYTESVKDSYFSMDSSYSSYSNLRRFIENNQAINADSIRTDELINYFHYDFEHPTDDTFAATAELGDAPWSDNKLLTLGITTQDVDENKFKGNNYVFLIDVSGSMSGEQRLGLVKYSLNYLVDNLDDDDSISIVTYASGVNVLADGISGNFKSNIKEKINSLKASGATYGQGGIEKAYEIALKNYIVEGNNRIIIATDGDFNVGTSSTGSITDLVKSHLNENIFVTCLGFGMGNYKDEMMEAIAKNGNGGFFYIDSKVEAEKVFGEDLQKTMFIVAKDTKTKISFNKDVVKAYRLIGYENKLLTEEEFNDDTADAGEIGSGHTSVVCYELILQEEASRTENAFTLDIHYKDPAKNESKTFEKAFTINNSEGGLSDTFQFVSSVVEFSLILRKSPYAEKASYSRLVARLENTPSVHTDKEKGEFFSLVFKAKQEKLVASDVYDNVCVIIIDFGYYFARFIHKPGETLRTSSIIEALGYEESSPLQISLFYDMTFAEKYVDTQVSSSLVLFAKVDRKTPIV